MTRKERARLGGEAMKKAMAERRAARLRPRKHSVMVVRCPWGWFEIRPTIQQEN